MRVSKATMLLVFVLTVYAVFGRIAGIAPVLGSAAKDDLAVSNNKTVGYKTGKIDRSIIMTPFQSTKLFKTEQIVK